MKSENFFTADQKAALMHAIEEAEKNCSGEIRIHIENHCRTEILDRAVEVFAKLEMHKTALRNGVLVYLAIEDRKFAIIGDVGINIKVEANFWNEIKKRMAELFREGKFTEGIVEAVVHAGQQLKTYFPYQKDDVNELSDDISFENN